MIADDVSKKLPLTGSDNGFSPREYRKALGRFATGVSVVTTQQGDRIHGMTANAFVSVSLNPPLVLLSVDNRSHMHQILPATLRYGVSVLAESQESLGNHFAGRSIDGLEINFITRQDMPLLEGAVAYFVVHVADMYPAGDHTLYIGRVTHFECIECKPLLFYGGQYEKIRG
jgi:flavin reductase (DIM6/NTAB) family NADH-FMN oxidoreductase RutF